LTAHLSELALHRLLAGEPGDGGDHVRACGECGGRLAELARDAAEFRRAAPLGQLAGQTRRRLGAQKRRWRAGALLALSAAAMALVLARAPAPDLRKKGGLQLDVLRKGASGAVEVLLPSGSAFPGDGLRFRLSTPKDGFAGVVSIDGAGAVSAYFPGGAQLLPIARGPARLLDGSVELDDTLGRERLIALVCSEAIPSARVLAAIRDALAAAHGDAARLDLSPAKLDCATTSFWFTKVPRP
jgi:hypothetical protein